MPEPVKKKDAYAKRNSMGITVPQDDSDPEFRAGPYIPTPAKPKVKRLKKKRPPANAKGGDSSDDNDDYVPLKKTKKGRRVYESDASTYKAIGSNLLKEIFGKGDFGLIYSSDDEAEDEEDGSQNIDQLEEESSRSSQSLSLPATARTPESKPANVENETIPALPAKRKASPDPIDSQAKRLKMSADADAESSTHSQAATGNSLAKKEEVAVEEGSTEDESEVEAKPTTMAKVTAEEGSTEEGSTEEEPEVKQKPGSPTKVEVEEGSTEEETDVEQKPVAQTTIPVEELSTEERRAAERKRVAEWLAAGGEGSTEEDSETESESLYSNKLLVSEKPRPRPDFPTPPGQESPGICLLDEVTGLNIPEPLNKHLRGYQRDGVRFLLRQFKAKAGGLLCDDMGLGKTVQVISFLTVIMDKTGLSTDCRRRERDVLKNQIKLGDNWRKRGAMPKPNYIWPTCLIIAPTSVCPNWEREFETWGYFEVGMYTDSPAKRADVLNDFKLGRLDVLITSFAIALSDIELLCDEAFSCIFVDEAHKLKSQRSRTTEAFHRFPQTGRFGLTGTAIQNSYDELWVLLNWTNPGRVGTSKQWKQCVSGPLMAGQSASATAEERTMQQRVANALVNDLLPQVFLRRTKEVIKEQLPKKFDNVVFCPMTKAQIIVYKRILNLDEVRNLVNTKQPCECGSKKMRKDCCHPFEAKNVFRFIGVLTSLANHMALLIPNKDTGQERYQRDMEVASQVLPEKYLTNQEMHLWNSEFCGKWKTLHALLKQWKKDPSNKVLIFTKSVKLMTMLEHQLQVQNYNHLRFDGSTDSKDRMPLVDKFQTDPDVFIFLISVKAGGTGLNLVAANKVVIFDPNWNPAHDLQAMDRAFRYGQKRDVTVVRLIAAGSIEELIYARQLYKQQQMAIGYEASVQTRYFAGVQGDTSKRGELFGLENIFSLQEDEVTTKVIIEEAKIAELDWAKAQSNKKSKKNNPNAELLEAEKTMKGEEGGMKGFASFLFDDDVPPVEEIRNTEQDELQKILRATGASYSHRNDEIVAESRIAKAMGKAGKATRRKRTTTVSSKEAGGSTSKGKGKKPAAAPVPWYPIRRKHHLKEEPIDVRLDARLKALLGIKYIEDKSEIPELAEQMKGWTHAQREALFTQLDDWQKKQWDY